MSGAYKRTCCHRNKCHKATTCSSPCKNSGVINKTIELHLSLSWRTVLGTITRWNRSNFALISWSVEQDGTHNILSLILCHNEIVHPSKYSKLYSDYKKMGSKVCVGGGWRIERAHLNRMWEISSHTYDCLNSMFFKCVCVCYCY